MPIWILKVLAMGLLLGLAALAFERSARLRRMPTRWIWGASMIASLLIPFMVARSSPPIPTPRPVPEWTAPLQHSDESPAPAVTASAAPVALAPPSWDVDAQLLQVWGALSAALFLAIAANLAWVHRRQRHWKRGSVAGASVYVSEDSGPAVFGLVRPRIVVPRWLSALTPQEQDLVIAHEQSHLEARDAQFLAVALLCLVCVPWNVALWWQLRRLRAAIEIDCDTRILEGGHDVARYGETLIAVGRRQISSAGAVAAMSASSSFLEQRIRIMLGKKTKSAWISVLALTGLGAALVATAAEVSPSAKDISATFDTAFDTSSLNRYAGLYRFPDDAVLTVTRKGDHLLAQLSGPTVPAQSKLSGPAFPIKSTNWTPGTEFSYKQADAQIRFNTPYSLVLRLDGDYFPATRIDETARQHLVDLQTGKTPRPKGEKAVQHFVEVMQDGQLDDDAATRMVVTRLRQKGSDLPAQIAALGRVQSVRYLGIDGARRDMFEAQHEHGLMQWLVRFDSDGNIVTVGALMGIKARPKWQ